MYLLGSAEPMLKTSPVDFSSPKLQKIDHFGQNTRPSVWALSRAPFCSALSLQDEPGLSRYEKREYSTLALSPEIHRAL